MKKRVKKLASKALRLIGCAGVGAIGIAIDAPALLTIAIAKSPVLLWKGWKQNIINMETFVEEGTCSLPLCVPAATAGLLIWPIHVAVCISSALLRGFSKGCHGAVVAYREKSLATGLKHIIAAIAEYDEYSNDVAALRQGSCIPRPDDDDHHRKDHQQEPVVAVNVIREFQTGKLVEYLTSTQARMRAKGMIEEDVLNKSLATAVSWTLFHYLLDSSTTKRGEEDQPRAPGGVGVVEYDPLEILEYQIRDAKLQELEELYLDSFILGDEEDLKELEPELDPIRKATIQGFGRRIRGIGSFVAAKPEFRKQYATYVRGVIAASQDLISFE